MRLRRIDDSKPVELRAALAQRHNEAIGDMELRAAARLNRDAAPAAVCDDYLDRARARADRARADRARVRGDSAMRATR